MSWLSVSAPERTVRSDPGVVDQDLDSAELLVNLGHEPLHVLAVPDVAGTEIRPDFHLAKTSGDLLGIQARLGTRVEEAEGDVHAALRELDRDGAADPAGSSGHDRHLTPQVGGVEERLGLGLSAYLVEKSLDGAVDVGIHGGTGYAPDRAGRNRPIKE